MIALVLLCQQSIMKELCINLQAFDICKSLTETKQLCSVNQACRSSKQKQQTMQWTHKAKYFNVAPHSAHAAVMLYPAHFLGLGSFQTVVPQNYFQAYLQLLASFFQLLQTKIFARIKA